MSEYSHLEYIRLLAESQKYLQAAFEYTMSHNKWRPSTADLVALDFITQRRAAHSDWWAKCDPEEAMIGMLNADVVVNFWVEAWEQFDEDLADELEKLDVIEREEA